MFWGSGTPKNALPGHSRRSTESVSARTNTLATQHRVRNKKTGTCVNILMWLEGRFGRRSKEYVFAESLRTLSNMCAALPNATLRAVPNAGHALREPGTRAALAATFAEVRAHAATSARWCS